MSKIKLDPRRLLGFKIIANNRSAMSLCSPKIGGKLCAFMAGGQAAAASMVPRAKIGTKLPD